jgi:hypothetical protein
MKKAGKFVDEGALVFKDGKVVLKFKEGASVAEKYKAFKLALKSGVKSRALGVADTLINKSSVLSSMRSRINGVVNKLLDFHPIKKLTQIIKDTKFVEGAIKTKKMLTGFIKSKARAIADRALDTVAGKAAKEAAGKVGKALGKVFKAFKVVGSVASKALPIIGLVANFAFEMFMRRGFDTDFQTNLNIAAGKAMDIQATASQIKSGVFPTETEPAEDVDLETEETEDGQPMQDIGLFSEANLYRETETVNVPEDSACYDEFTEYQEYMSQPEDDRDEIEERGLSQDVDNCLIAEGENYDDAGNFAYSFWDSPMVKHELGDPNFQTHDSLKTAGFDVPPELLIENYDEGSRDQLLKDIANSLIATFVIVSPDMFEDTDDVLDTETANPTQVGSITTPGAISSANATNLAAGGHSRAEGSSQAGEMRTTAKQFVQDEFNAKPLLARLFDVTDYRSAVVTLAHNSGWDTSDSSIGTQLKNVAKTFAMLPNLIASSFNKASYAASGASSTDFYGFGLVGYTDEELNALPDYDVAADGIIKYHSEIDQGKLKDLGVKEITEDGRITYQSDTDAKNLDVRAEKESFLTHGQPEHVVHLCEDGSFIWDDETTGEDDPRIAECYTDTVYDEDESTDDDGNIVMTENKKHVIVGKATYKTDDMVRAYLLDYPLMMAAAAEDWQDSINEAFEGEEDAADQRSELSKEMDEAMVDMGIMSGEAVSAANASSGSGSSEFGVDSVQAAFDAAGCAYDGYVVSSNGCTTLSQWFVGEYTTLTRSNGNGWKVASNLAAANHIATSDVPVAPAIFSTSTYHSSSVCGSGPGCAPNGKYGHTGLILKVEGDTVTTLETGSSYGGRTPCSFTSTYKLSEVSDMTYVNLGGYLK